MKELQSEKGEKGTETEAAPRSVSDRSLPAPPSPPAHRHPGPGCSSQNRVESHPSLQDARQKFIIFSQSKEFIPFPTRPFPTTPRTAPAVQRWAGDRGRGQSISSRDEYGLGES